jgi:hypothetical protein
MTYFNCAAPDNPRGLDQSKRPTKVVIEGFECPSCRATTYEAVTIDTLAGGPQPTGVYRCAECRFGFLNPERYVKRPHA